jgi:hypothetical protein
MNNKDLRLYIKKNIDTAQRITQHKKFVPYGAHPNSAFGGTSFMLETLSAMPCSEENEAIIKHLKRGGIDA